MKFLSIRCLHKIISVFTDLYRASTCPRPLCSLSEFVLLPYTFKVKSKNTSQTCKRWNSLINKSFYSYAHCICEGQKINLFLCEFICPFPLTFYNDYPVWCKNKLGTRVSSRCEFQFIYSTIQTQLNALNGHFWSIDKVVCTQV